MTSDNRQSTHRCPCPRSRAADMVAQCTNKTHWHPDGTAAPQTLQIPEICACSEARRKLVQTHKPPSRWPERKPPQMCPKKSKETASELHVADAFFQSHSHSSYTFWGMNMRSLGLEPMNLLIFRERKVARAYCVFQGVFWRDPLQLIERAHGRISPLLHTAAHQ